MAAFSEKEIRDNFTIWQVFRDGAIVFVQRQPVLHRLLRDLSENGYDIRTIECDFEDERDLESELRRVFELESGWGRDALNSQMWDLQFPQCTGLVIVLTQIDEFNHRFPKYFWNIVDILAHHCRIRMLMGERLLVVLQTDDGNMNLDDVGAVTPRWSHLENMTAEPE